jgi:hypothetical protein
MRPLRFAALFALVVWVGGLLTLGTVAAPAAFDVLERTADNGRTLAGAVFGETLRRFHVIAYACGVTLIGSLVVRAILGPRPRPFAIRLAIATVMLAAAAWAGLVVAPQIERTRAAIGVSPASLPEDDPRRIAFGRLHGLSTVLEMLPIVGGLALLWFEGKD